MSTELMPTAKEQFFYSPNGLPLEGGKLYTFAAGTTTPKATFTDSAGTTQQTNPIVLNARGEPDFAIFWDGAYKVRIDDADDNTIYTVDNYIANVAGNLQENLAGDTGTALVAGTWFGGAEAPISDLGSSTGASLLGFVQAGGGDVARSMQDKMRDIISVKDKGAIGDGTTNDTAAFTSARNASANGKYLIPPGTYLVDAAPDVWSDSFIAPYADTALLIGGTTYDISGSFGSGWCNDSNTQRYLTWKHARTGATIAIWSDGESSGDSHRLFLPWDIRRDSHYMIAAPATNGGSCDMLWRRSDVNADARGNRFNQTFEESPDRMLYSFATAASGSPGFDAYMRCYAGTSPKLDFPALAPCFRQGWTMQNRAETGYKLAWVIGTDRHHIQDAALSFTHMTFKSDGAVGFHGAGGITKPTITGSRGGNAALTNLLTQLSNYGLISDATTA